MAKRGRPPHPDILTPREWEVLALLRDGLSNEQVAERLGVSVRTARYHVSEIMSKLGVDSRKEAAAWAASGERRPWWAMAVAPIGLLGRRIGVSAPAGLSTVATALSGGLLLAFVGVLGLIGFLLLRGDGEEQPAAASVHATPTSTPQATETVVSDTGTPMMAFKAFSQNGAWALTWEGLLRTTDGGRSWADVTPPELGGGFFGTAGEPAAFFRDGSLAWLATFSTPAPPQQLSPPADTEPGPVSATIFHTADGGATWSSRVLALEVRPTSFGGKGRLFFYDESTGWLMARHMTSTAFSFGELYRTRDGGETWSQVSIPIADIFHFTSPSDGWVAGGAAGGELYVTHDGGETWTEQTVPQKSPDKPGLTTVALPTFFDGLSGVLPVEVRHGELESWSELYFYLSQDGGESWAPAGPPMELTHSGVIFGGRARGLAFVDAKTWMLSAEGQLSVTHDAGSSWSVVSTDERAGYAGQTYFTSTEEGWVYYHGGTCREKRDCVYEYHLLRTEDGGRTWEEISLP